MIIINLWPDFKLTYWECVEILIGLGFLYHILAVVFLKALIRKLNAWRWFCKFLSCKTINIIESRKILIMSFNEYSYEQWIIQELYVRCSSYHWINRPSYNDYSILLENREWDIYLDQFIVGETTHQILNQFIMIGALSFIKRINTLIHPDLFVLSLYLLNDKEHTNLNMNIRSRHFWIDSVSPQW